MNGRRGEAWNDEDYATLRRMAEAGEPIASIAKTLERSREAVAGKASKLKLRLRS